MTMAVKRHWLYLVPASEPAPPPDPVLGAIRQVHERVLAQVLETQRQPSKAADHLVFRLQVLADALETGDALAYAEALYRLGTDDGKGSGRIAARRADHRQRQQAGAAKRKDKTKAGGGKAAIIAAARKLNGGRLPPRLGRGMARQIAEDLGYTPDYVRQVVAEQRKKEM